MVISYSIQELYAIGEMMTITELLARGKSSSAELECNNKFNTVDFIKTFQKLINTQLHPTVDQQQSVSTSNSNINSTSSNYSNHEGDEQSQQQQPLILNRSDGTTDSGVAGGIDNNQGSLTLSVAEFFRKAQQNFYAQASIDPTKVRRLSEVEAELIGATERNDST